MKHLSFLLFFFQLFLAQTANCQKPELNADQWAKRLVDPDDKMNDWYQAMVDAFINEDSLSTFKFLDQLSRYAKANNIYFKARFPCFFVYMRFLKHRQGPALNPSALQKLNAESKAKLAQAMQDAYESGDDYLAAFVSGIYGNQMSLLNETELAVMYLTNSADLAGKVHIMPKCSVFFQLGELLWRIKDYENSIKYTALALSQLETLNKEEREGIFMMCSNTMALAYQRLGRYDSAFAYYNDALNVAEKINSSDWKGIVSGNIAQIYYAQNKFSDAIPLFTLDYTTSNKGGFYDNAANALQWLARTNLAIGNKDLARQQATKAFQLLKKWPNAGYLRNTYFTATEIYKSTGNTDSAYYYSTRYNNLNDSIEKVTYQSSMSIARLRISDEKNKYDILNLQRQKQTQIQQRNFAIIFIALAAAFALLLMNRQRLKLAYQRRIEQQERLIIEQEMQSARAQLQMFTGNLVEKANLVERLEQQLRSKGSTVEDQRAITELSNQTILSEEDWENFKSLFEKTFPLFFIRLKEKASDITQAEQRLAALMRLQLTTRQKASILGISLDSVHKTRQRLRKRFNLGTEANLEEYVAAV